MAFKWPIAGAAEAAPAKVRQLAKTGSTPRIQGDGLIPAAAATGLRPENDLRRADMPERITVRPTCSTSLTFFLVPLS
jgi:hypothetical protein